MPLRGAFAVLPAPLDATGGLDLESLRSLVERLSGRQISGLTVLSSGGDLPDLTLSEREEVLRIVRSSVSDVCATRKGRGSRARCTLSCLAGGARATGKAVLAMSAQIPEDAAGNLAGMYATVAECESNQTRWNAAVAVAGGGVVWEDEGLQWSWQAHNRHLMLSFPRSVDAAAVRRGIAAGRARNACVVGAWLSADADPAGLEAVGFERGWEPWWMAAPLDAIPAPVDSRVTLTNNVPEYGPGGQRLLLLASGDAPCAWHAVARVGGRFAGRAWCLVAGDIAGIYDMDVWPQFQRRGLGRALLRAVCGAARAAGATKAVLNATPEGEPLYSAERFVRIGTGITYWHHLRRWGSS